MSSSDEEEFNPDDYASGGGVLRVSRRELKIPADKVEELLTRRSNGDPFLNGNAPFSLLPEI